MKKHPLHPPVKLHINSVLLLMLLLILVSGFAGLTVCAALRHKSADGSISLFPILLLLGAFSLAAIVLYFVMVYLPIRRLAKALQQMVEGDFDTFLPEAGTSDLSGVSHEFNAFLISVRQIIQNEYNIKLLKKHAELNALQSQINPHFLYNTLDSIAWMCEQGRAGDAVKMIHALARLFRISISRGHELIPIAKEIEHAENYLEIQKYRYKNQFTYTFDVDPGCLDYYCNKITLQPIIENAIMHGLDLLVEEGHISVRVTQDGEDILFCVEDNGVGMSAEQAAAILGQEDQDRTGIGIKNVNDRLQIYFGKQYGLRIASELDVGTRVEIRMPKIKEAGGYETK